MSGGVHYNGERLTSADLRDIVKGLQTDTIRILSLRKCRMSDKGFSQICTALSSSKSLLQLNVNLGLLNNVLRAECLAQALERNRSLTSLFLHGSTCGEVGIVRVLLALATHPKVTTLDIGDCLLTDNAVPYVAKLVNSNGAKPGLKELTLSANKSITTFGWSMFCVAMATSTTLHTCHLDYNTIGDQGAACLSVALASNTSLRVVDLESCGLSDSGIQPLVFLMKNYSVCVKEIVLEDNSIAPHLKDEIYNFLRADESGTGSFSGTDEDSSTYAEESLESSSEEETGSKSNETHTEKSNHGSPGATSLRSLKHYEEEKEEFESNTVDLHSISSSSSVISKYIKSKDWKRAQSDTETEKSMPVEIIALRGRPEFMERSSNKSFSRKASKISFGDARTYAIISQNQSLTPVRKRSVKIQTDMLQEVVLSSGRTPSHTSRSSHSEASACIPIMISHRE